VAAAAIGAAQAIVVANLLGPEAYGIIAVLTALNAAVLNFLDVRLGDLAAKLYYDVAGIEAGERSLFRASVLHLCVAGSAGISVVLLVIGTAVSFLLAHVFLSAPVRPVWMVEQAAIVALTNWTGTFVYLQRLSGRFHLIGTIRIVTQAVATSVLLIVLVQGRTLSAYYQGSLSAAAVQAVAALGASWYIWRRLEGVPLRWNTPARAWSAYAGHVGFVFFGNLLGYAKMFHRAMDTLLIAAISNDATVGLYKFARSVTDNLYILYDAANQVYTPRFLELLGERRHDEYRSEARRLTVAAAMLTAAVIVLELAVGRPVLHALVGGRYDGAFAAIVWLTVPFFLATGLQLWMWPIFVSGNRLRAYAFISYAAVAVQYGVAVLLLMRSPEQPSGAAVGYCLHYVVLTALCAYQLHRWQQASTSPVQLSPAK
jgi:O-antigen/teichoic acid export membrane protein